MILNQINNMGTTGSERFADCTEMTIEENGEYTINLQPADETTKVLELCFTEQTVDDFTLNLSGNMLHQSVVMNGNKSRLRLHSIGDKWRVVGSRRTNITN